jgi:hypothetical protein
VAGLAPIENHSPFGVLPNKAHQDAGGFKPAKTYELAIVEFDDQGRCYNRQQMEDVADRLDEMRTKQEDVILLVFVHGWKHNAETNDPNLVSFCDVLARTARHEAKCATGAPRPVMGVYVGWRGKSIYGVGDVLADTTFWGRQDAGQRVSTGSVRELLGRLRHYRNSRLKNRGSPLLVIAGHSFGGMIVFSALAQSLIQAASAPVGRVIAGFADLVLLANPAIEGARYLPIQDLVTSARFENRTSAQLPVFVCVQARNDQPVGTWFPLGNFKNRLGEAAIGDLERRCVTHAIGFIDEFRTHELSGPAASNPFILDPPEIKRSNPFWVVSADKQVVDGHGGIWKAPFLSFLASIIFQHVNLSRSDYHGARSGGVPSPDSDSEPVSLAKAVIAKADAASDLSEGSLADFAREIDPPMSGEGVSPSSADPTK